MTVTKSEAQKDEIILEGNDIEAVSISGLFLWVVVICSFSDPSVRAGS